MTHKGMPSDPMGRWLFDGTFPMPVATLDWAIVQANAELMQSYCQTTGIALAPHAKTTMSPQLVGLQRDLGAWGMTIATAWQASRVAEMGVDRLILASPVSDSGSLHLVAQVARSPRVARLLMFVDTTDLVDLIHDCLPEPVPGLGLIVETGVVGGRTGARTVQAALEVAEAVHAGPHPLSGVGAFEGIIPAGEGDGVFVEVDAFLEFTSQVAHEVHRAGLLETVEPILTAGGSAFPDRVVTAFASNSTSGPYLTVLRSGCYITHDCGAYDEVSPFGCRPRLDARLRPALTVWGAVVSRPEPTRAIANIGRRDVSFDAGLPRPREVRRRANGFAHAHDASDLTVVAVNDQHAYLDLAGDRALEVGDLIGFGISHPCTTFDKWGALVALDGTDHVISVVTTKFG